jgi:hypothetical protein
MYLSCRNATVFFSRSNNQSDEENEREGLEMEGLEGEGLERLRLEREGVNGLFLF